MNDVYEIVMCNNLRDLNDVKARLEEDSDITKAEMSALYEIIDEQKRRICLKEADIKAYRKLSRRYIDDDNNIVTEDEVKRNYEAMTESERSEYGDGSFRDYLSACMVCNNGILSEII